jgi:hypothetical protein
MTGNVFSTGGGNLGIEAKLRRPIPFLKCEVSKGNPPMLTASGAVDYLRTSLVIPITIDVPNIGPPKFKTELKDVTTRVGEILKIKLPQIIDPDLEDNYKIESIDFAAAETFITGSYPTYTIAPFNNDTDPGIY